ncbi:hypothetical protein K458DRAFT_431163 [Lentithecium fluviatile CBS 122367]|uniref:Uncharacterized protein n=1 Tax=Lentithecium fluviatile CBS 122367 TaxID=1168545 RepID=A0A6G1J436_9PLEO|nr:hypothetical protein K458DRAFT_431163 [Lentithecium fluviatile CBS 122367]
MATPSDNVPNFYSYDLSTLPELDYTQFGRETVYLDSRHQRLLYLDRKGNWHTCDGQSPAWRTKTGNGQQPAQPSVAESTSPTVIQPSPPIQYNANAPPVGVHQVASPTAPGHTPSPHAYAFENQNNETVTSASPLERSVVASGTSTLPQPAPSYQVAPLPAIPSQRSAINIRCEDLLYRPPKAHQQNCPSRLGHIQAISDQKYSQDGRVLLDTARAQWKLDTRSIGFSTGQYFNINMNQTYKKTPQRPPMDTIVEKLLARNTANPVAAPFTGFGTWMCGLLVSRCYLKAIRVSLWNLLTCTDSINYVQAAFSQDSDLSTFLTICRSKSSEIGLSETERAVSEKYFRHLLSYLCHTGCYEGGKLIVWEPFTASGWVIRPRWTKFLVETEQSSCFAMQSDRCFSFEFQSPTFGLSTGPTCGHCGCQNPTIGDAMLLLGVRVHVREEDHTEGVAKGDEAYQLALGLTQEVWLFGGVLPLEPTDVYEYLIRSPLDPKNSHKEPIKLTRGPPSGVSPMRILKEREKFLLLEAMSGLFTYGKRRPFVYAYTKGRRLKVNTFLCNGNHRDLRDSEYHLSVCIYGKA